MEKITYTKQPLTIEEQISLLKSRGLNIDHDEKTRHILTNIGYYHLSGYFYPLLLDKTQHIYKPNSNFEDAFNLYCFDRELRRIIFNEIEKIEISFRTQLIYFMSHEYGAFWFEKAELFRDLDKYNKLIASLTEQINDSSEQFIKAYKEKYSEPLPPCWISMKITTLGQTSKLYSLLHPSRTKRDIANFYGVSDQVFPSWIHCLTYVRNICAHHSRLWNRELGVYPKLPRNPKNSWLISQVPNNKIFFTLSIIRYLLFTVNPSSTFTEKLKVLFKKYPETDKGAMGFPRQWEKEILWS
jgi:abortive infection bacteriophage resistance protein